MKASLGANAEASLGVRVRLGIKVEADSSWASSRVEARYLTGILQ